MDDEAVVSDPTPSAPRATYGVAVSIIDYLSSNKDKTMTEIVKATGISRVQFSVTINELTGIVIGEYKVRTIGGRTSNFHIYNVDDEEPLEFMLRQLRQKLPD